MPSYYDPREETTPFSLFAKEYQILRQGKEDEEQQQMEKAKTYAQLSTLPIKIAEGYRTGELAETNQLLSIKDKDYEYVNAVTNISGSKVFVPQQMSFNAETAVWSGQWIEADVDSASQSYSVAYVPNQNPVTNSPSIY